MSIQSDLTSDNYKPAPNCYNPTYNQVQLQNPNYSIRPKYGNKVNNSNPAPNAYKPQKPQTQPPIYSMKSRHTDLTQSTVPGPGAYEVDNFKSLKPKNPVRTIAPRLPQSGSNQTPGPSDYLPVNNTSGPAFSMKPRAKNAMKNENPGPGAYTPTTNTTQTPSFSVGQKIYTQKLNDTPGPNHYKVTQPSQSKSVQIPRVGHQLNGRDNGVPGPGQYQKMSEIEGQNFSMRFKHFGSGKNDVPGPGTYSAKYDYTMPDNKGASMGFRVAQNAKNDVPGPGRYDVVTAKSAPKFSIGNKLKDKIGDVTPSGNEYQRVSHNIPVQGFKFNKQNRQVKVDSTTGKLGPGGYQISRDLNQNGVYLHGKYEMGRKDDFPGPGSYDWNSSTMSKQGASIHLKTKRAWRTE